MIFGRPGSGKSTFASKLHNISSIPLFHLDRYFYIKNWVERNYEEFLHIQEQIVSQDQWIIDGNCIKSLELRYHRANLCLYFNYPRWLCYYRIVKRLFTKDRTMKDRAAGCNETIQYSLISYMWNFEKRVANQIEKMKARYPQVIFIEITNNKALRILQKQLFAE